LVIMWINYVKNHKKICEFFQNVSCGSMAGFLLNVITMYPLVKSPFAPSDPSLSSNPSSNP
jgi:hypothetical protein